MSADDSLQVRSQKRPEGRLCDRDFTPLFAPLKPTDRPRADPEPTQRSRPGHRLGALIG